MKNLGVAFCGFSGRPLLYYIGRWGEIANEEKGGEKKRHAKEFLQGLLTGGNLGHRPLFKHRGGRVEETPFTVECFPVKRQGETIISLGKSVSGPRHYDVTFSNSPLNTVGGSNVMPRGEWEKGRGKRGRIV